MQIFIQPSDVLLFRDARPFSVGEGHRAKSIFPPYLNTMQGVIRSKVLAERCGNYQLYRDGCLNCSKLTNCSVPDEIGRPAKDGQGSYGAMQIKASLIAKYYNSKLTAYFHVPADVVQVKNKSNDNAESKLNYLQPLQQKLPGYNDLSTPLLPLWTPETTPVEGIQGYWSQQDLVTYLLGQQLNNFIQPSKLYEYEARLGIEVNYEKQATEEGKLYQTEFIRCLDNIGLYVEFQGIKQISEVADINYGLIAIGGENRAASYNTLEAIDWGNLKHQLSQNLKQLSIKRFKVYLATPTIFEQGWLPKWINSETLEGSYNNIKLTLKAAAISRYQTIGGWDIAYNRPKPTYRAIAPGSVYYFETQASYKEILDTFHWQNLADDQQNAQIGFGLCLVGIWDYCDIFKG